MSRQSREATGLGESPRNRQKNAAPAGGGTRAGKGLVRAFPRFACTRLGQARTGDLQKECCTNSGPAALASPQSRTPEDWLAESVVGHPPATR
jgi:hypothetical protein